MEVVLRKLTVENLNPAKYFLPGSEVCINDWIGTEVSINYTGKIVCSSCGKNTKKSFGGGFCYPCFTTAPEASECIIFPEKCKAHFGIARDVQWGLDNHVQPHIVYLASTSKIKVGVTRETQMPTRWLDQGADAALVLAKVPNRHIAGVIEVFLKQFFSDKTSWQQMLKTDAFNIDDLTLAWEKAKSVLPPELAVYTIDLPEVQTFKFPFLPSEGKLTQINLEKMNSYKGVLRSIKGQYLLFEDGAVFNVRRHTGYIVNLSN